MFRIGLAAKFLGVGTKTIRRWEISGKIKSFRTLGGHRRFSLPELQRVKLGKKRILRKKIRAALYVRVSTYDQKKHGDLDRQIELGKRYCLDKKLDQQFIFSDVASGLNGKRRGLWKLLDTIEKGKIDCVLLSYRDRLTRFGYEYLKHYAKSYSCKIIEIQEKEKKSIQSELIDDLISIVTSFSGKIHGMCSWKNKKKIAA